MHLIEHYKAYQAIPTLTLYFTNMIWDTKLQTFAALNISNKLLLIIPGSPDFAYVIIHTIPMETSWLAKIYTAFVSVHLQRQLKQQLCAKVTTSVQQALSPSLSLSLSLSLPFPLYPFHSLTLISLSLSLSSPFFFSLQRAPLGEGTVQYHMHYEAQMSSKSRQTISTHKYLEYANWTFQPIRCFCHCIPWQPKSACKIKRER